MSSMSSVYRLKCAVQHYEWGKIGIESKVAQFIKGVDNFQIEDNKPYAELWMGTHPNGPSILSNQSATSLKEIIKSNPEYLTQGIAKLYNDDLPFLFKVLSVQKALSIQAHPNKKLGKELFEKFPKIYKDPNHKPEMAVAITNFEALCGFRPLEEIISFLSEYPEFRELVGNEVSSRFIQIVSGKEDSKDSEVIELNKVALRELFTNVMTADTNFVISKVKKLISRLSSNKNIPLVGSTQELLIRLNNQFPGDVGIFCVLILNYIKLEPGQAIFLGANEPHAYLSGDCVECMAASDNVVRAGLTPKFKDVSVLVNMLTYKYGSAKSQILKPTPYNNSKNSLLYDPPIEEFSVILTRLNPQNNKREVFEGIAGPSILIVTEGKGSLLIDNKSKNLEPGSIFFIGSKTSFVIEAAEGCQQLISYCAFSSLK
ncbi:4348_t:CDS:2 [Diversispora eburnea]|uniref:Mannose-6-phosphate isomerase n=1 Tax=Diversispora eburnea TaxID=1213867 RepID=A0A9N9FF85_9GLOM|nr:4348_t:CDS:2 [Diversispora eburnea]